jgi:hypothetical protein
MSVGCGEHRRAKQVQSRRSAVVNFFGFWTGCTCAPCFRSSDDLEPCAPAYIRESDNKSRKNPRREAARHTPEGERKGQEKGKMPGGHKGGISKAKTQI